jgi:hypothetical protein
LSPADLEQATRQGDLAVIGIDHRRPPHAVIGDDGPPHVDGDLTLRTGTALPVPRIAALAKKGSRKTLDR